MCRGSLERFKTRLDWEPAGATPDVSHGRWAPPLSCGQFLVTLLFAAVLAFAVHARAMRPDAHRQPKSNVTIQQEAPTKVFVDPK